MNENNKNEYIELEQKKYVIATLGNPTNYLISKHFGKYAFTDSIEAATKTRSKKLANELLGYFYQDTEIKDLDMVVVPVTITYSFEEE